MSEGAIIRSWRTDAGLPRGTLAQLLGVSKRMIGAVERGERRLHERHFPQLPQPLRHAVVEARIQYLRELSA